jgi:hypothetical protein
MGRPIKIAETIEKHKDVEIRLAASFLQSAMKHAKTGNIIRMLACIRLASTYEQAVPSETMLELRTND